MPSDEGLINPNLKIFRFGFIENKSNFITFQNFILSSLRNLSNLIVDWKHFKNRFVLFEKDYLKLVSFKAVFSNILLVDIWLYFELLHLEFAHTIWFLIRTGPYHNNSSRCLKKNDKALQYNSSCEHIMFP
jgi:hypothetical protein